MSPLADHHRGGDGPPLLLVHGFTATWRAWGPVWGDADRVLTQRKHEAFFREALPQARFHTIKRAGHVPFWDAPERVADVIAQTAFNADRQREKAAR